MGLESDTLTREETISRTPTGSAFLQTFRTLQNRTSLMVPPRKALTLGVARAFAPYMSILEVVAPMHVVLRIVGTGHVNRTRLENTGKNWFDLAEPAQHQAHWTHFQRILRTPCGCIGHYREKYDRPLLIEAINLPFADDTGRARFIVSTNVQMNLEELLLRGDARMVPGDIVPQSYIDIGAGIGA